MATLEKPKNEDSEEENLELSEKSLEPVNTEKLIGNIEELKPKKKVIKKEEEDTVIKPKEKPKIYKQQVDIDIKEEDKVATIDQNEEKEEEKMKEKELNEDVVSAPSLEDEKINYIFPKMSNQEFHPQQQQPYVYTIDNDDYFENKSKMNIELEQEQQKQQQQQIVNEDDENIKEKVVPETQKIYQLEETNIEEFELKNKGSQMRIKTESIDNFKVGIAKINPKYDMLINEHLVNINTAINYDVKNSFKNQSLKYENVLYVGLHGNVLAFDCSEPALMSDDKTIIWKTKLEKSFWAMDITKIFFEYKTDFLYASYHKNVYCLEPKTGFIKWRTECEVKMNYILPLYDGVWICGKQLKRLNKETGDVEFNLDLKTRNFFLFNFIQFFEKPFICSDQFSTRLLTKENKNYQCGKYLYICFHGRIGKIDRKTLKIVYFTKDKKFNSHPTLMMYNEKYLIGTGTKTIYLINSETGEIVRRTEFTKGLIRAMQFNNILWPEGCVAILLRNKTTMFVSYLNRLFAIHPLTHQIYWETCTFHSYVPLVGGKVKQPIGCPQNCINQDDDRIYVSGGGKAAAYNPETGKLIWKVQLSKLWRLMVTTFIKGGVLFCGYHGDIYGLNPENGKIIFKNHLKGQGSAFTFFSGITNDFVNTDHCSQPVVNTNWQMH